jgi:ornithine--oxo-acid transaminase
VEFHSDQFAYNFSKKMLSQGVVAKPTQKNIIRFSPPLVMTDEQLSEACTLIEKAWKNT